MGRLPLIDRVTNKRTTVRVPTVKLGEIMLANLLGAQFLLELGHLDALRMSFARLADRETSDLALAEYLVWYGPKNDWPPKPGKCSPSHI